MLLYFVLFTTLPPFSSSLLQLLFMISLSLICHVFKLPSLIYLLYTANSLCFEFNGTKAHLILFAMKSPPSLLSSSNLTMYCMQWYFCFSYNGQLPLQNRGKYKTYFKLHQKPMANGVMPVDQFTLNSSEAKMVGVIHQYYMDHLL